MLRLTKKFCIAAVKKFNFCPGQSHEVLHLLLSAEEHVDQQLQQIGLAYHGPEEEFGDEAGRDALQHGGCEEDASKALLVPRAQELDHLAEGMLSLLLQAFDEQSCL